MQNSDDMIDVSLEDGQAGMAAAEHQRDDFAQGSVHGSGHHGRSRNHDFPGDSLSKFDDTLYHLTFAGCDRALFGAMVEQFENLFFKPLSRLAVTQTLEKGSEPMPYAL